MTYIILKKLKNKVLDKAIKNYSKYTLALRCKTNLRNLQTWTGQRP